MNIDKLYRRHWLKAIAPIAMGCSLPRRSMAFQSTALSSSEKGVVVGEATGEKAGMQVLLDGGNAIDAIVSAALTAAVAAPHMTGIGGYGMSAIVASASRHEILAIDGNTAAPSAMNATIFQPDATGKLPDGINTADGLSSIGWLSAGVPGILSGLQLAIDEFGTRGFAELVQPAILLAREGFPWPKNLVATIASRQIFQTDTGSRQLFYPNGNPHAAGELFKNPALAEMLTSLAKKNSVADFYRGDIANQIADGFAKNGGLVTASDLAAYEARLVPALAINWGASTVHTAPLTAGGLSVLQMLQTLKAMKWDSMPDNLLRKHARLEAMRLAWHDRLTLLGDPALSNVPVARLLADEYATDSAAKILASVKDGKSLTHQVKTRTQGGTIHLCAADRFGNFAALTLTHGNAFGACVTVDGLGLTLGHGMSRFDFDPHHPNAPGPNKRPLHNMVPTIVTRDEKPVLAVGGTGGRKIPNGLFEVLTQFVVHNRPVAKAIAAPRVHTDGSFNVELEKSWPTADVDSFRKLGYQVKTAGNATMSAVALEDKQLIKAKR